MIDLNPEANQPMNFGKYWIVFNGEIYNYKEIKAELIQKGVQFSTSSDTEVILKSYDFYGEKCVEKFIGMWAFSIFNKEENCLFCSRDRFGIKPFYYINHNEEFFFSSEIKSLKTTPYFSSNLNLSQVNRGMQLGWIGYKNETYFSGIQTLEPGHNLLFKDKNLSISKYWSYPSTQTAIDTKEAVHQFKELFDNSLQLHVRSDVPIGATLSGGIDSSSIVSSLLKNKMSSNLETFSIYYDSTKGFDERPFIQTIEQKYPGQFQLNYYSPTEQEIAKDFNAIANTMDFPLSGSSPISQYYVMKLAKEKGIKVILSGQGADDYMGGYMHSYYRLYAEWMKHFQFGKLSKGIKDYKKIHEASNSKLTNVLMKSALSSLMREDSIYKFEYKNYLPFLGNKHNDWQSFDNYSSGKLNEFHFALMNYSSLPTLLHYEDRNSMAHSIESRVPFLDHRLVELLFQFPDNLKINNGWTKFALRQSMEGVLPKEIQWRTDKKGFVTPGEILWLRGSLAHLLEIDYTQLSFLDKTKTKKIIDEFKAGNNKFATLVWRIATLNHWMKQNT
ncbi:MAG: asparagine synthase (glutamine-hydrolyzing) [Flavobacteriales bacterium]|nr:asparagine synthase (glutamine-hydrolyzing) [Flavobacteriales bacterium]